MNARSRSRLILAATLLLGVVLGVLLVGAVGQWHASRQHRMRGPGGFAEHMERILEPRDQAQRDAIRSILQAADERNRAIVDQGREQMEASLQEMKTQLAPLLDERQRERLERFDGEGRGDPFGPPPPPGGRPSRQRPPPPKR